MELTLERTQRQIIAKGERIQLAVSLKKRLLLAEKKRLKIFKTKQSIIASCV